MKLDLLAIGAHPDDVELGCAGLLLAEKSTGKKTGIIDLTRGELGTRGTKESRSQEAGEASKILRLDARENLEMADGFFQNDEKHQRKLIAAIRKYRPEIIIATAPEDRHPDHGRSAQLIKDAAFLSGLKKIETTENGKEQEAWRPKYVFHFIQDRYLQPNFVYDITPYFLKKIEAIRAFKTQFFDEGSHEPETYISKPGFLESIEHRARIFGKMIGVEYAEGFISEKTIGISSLNVLTQKTT